MIFNRPLQAFILLLALFTVSCGSKDNGLFKDPSLAKGDEGVYRVNGEKMTMPAFFSLPPENKSIKLSFEKPGMRPAEINLRYGVDGWHSDNGRVLSGGNMTGIVVDFLSGDVYEMPKDEVSAVLGKFTADNATVIKATRSKLNPSGFVKMAVEDGQMRYGKDELKHLTLLNGSPLPKTILSDSQPTVTGPDNKPGVDRDAVYVGKPIISAAANGQYDRLLRLLAGGGVNINEVEDATGDSALIKSIRNGDAEAATLLLNNNINPKTINKSGQNALHVSSDMGFYDLSKRLLDAGLSPNGKDNAGNTPLMYAATSPNPYLTDLLVEKGGKLEERNKKGETPLMLAALTGNTKTVENLIKRGADIKTADNEGNGVVMKSAAGGNEFTLKSLLALGASPDMPNKNGVRPIHAAVRTGDDAIVTALIEKGANLNMADPAGNTPLMLAAARGDLPMTEKLLSYKPDANAKNKEDKSAYEIAADKGYQRIERIIAESVRKLDDMTVLLFDRVAANDADGAAKAVERGANVNATEISTGNTPLFTAVANNFNFTAGKLITLGADVNHKNLKGNIPLIIAVTSSDIPMINLLVAAGSNVNTRNNNGDTALIWAVKLKSVDMVRALLVAGADANLKNNDGVTAYLIAYNEGPVEITNLLQAAGGRR